MADVLSRLAGYVERGNMIYQILGLILFILGCAHLLPAIKPLETRIVLTLQSGFRNKPWLPFFQEIWFFGRTSFAVITIVLLISLNWKLGSTALVVFLIIVGIEQIVKMVFNRARPYTADSEITMLQLISPHDPSFPSGDALRIWYLALILPFAAGISSLFLAATLLLAILVTLGRIVMGVHYLTDTFAGSGLGILGAGTTIWLWHLLNLL